MVVVPVYLTLDADVGRSEARGPRHRPVAMNPTTVNLELEEGRQQTGERPIKTVIRGVASFDRTIHGGKIRCDGLIGNGRIVERERADEEAIARNPMRVRCVGSQD